MDLLYSTEGFPGGSDGKKSACSAGDPGSVPGLGRPPWRREYSTGNSTQYSVTYMRKESKKRVDICVTDSFCCKSETNMTL